MRKIVAVILLACLFAGCESKDRDPYLTAKDAVAEYSADELIEMVKVRGDNSMAEKVVIVWGRVESKNTEGSSNYVMIGSGKIMCRCHRKAHLQDLMRGDPIGVVGVLMPHTGNNGSVILNNCRILGQ